jgi:hypothetical protein
MLLGLVAAGLGAALLFGDRRKAEPSERVGDDELPQAGDLQRELEALGLTPTGEPRRLDEPKVTLDVIETTGTEAPAPAPV